MKAQEKTKEQPIKQLTDLRKQLTDLKKTKNQRKAAEEALIQILRQNDLILNSAGEGIYGLDRNGLTTFVNPAAARMLGWLPEELHGKPQHAVIHHTRPDGTPYPKEECPIYAAFKDERIHCVDNEVFWRKDGTSFPVLRDQDHGTDGDDDQPDGDDSDGCALLDLLHRLISLSFSFARMNLSIGKFWDLSVSMSSRS